MKRLPQKPSFTLIEVIVAMTVFIMLATSGIMLLTQVSKMSHEVEMREVLYTETQAALEKMSRIIQDSAIDYEEYNSRILEQGISDPFGDPFGGSATYGDNYGEYHSNFFDATGNEVGINPAGGIDDTANAMCEGWASCSDNPTYYSVGELYLIDGSGTERTYFVLEGDGTENAISMIKMIGTDEIDSGGSPGQNGLIDTWVCADNYTCNGTDSHPEPEDRTDGRDSENFVPITPSNINIDELHFYIAPIEDPFKAFAEDQHGTSSTKTFESVQIQPKVIITIVASYVDNGITGPSITLQTTVGTGVYNKIPTSDGP